MTSQWIDIPAADGQSFKGYLATSPVGRGPGILLIQEIFGVNAHIRGVADQYAMDGFTVLAPDVFWRIEPRVELGYGEADFGKGLYLMRRCDMPQAVRDLTASLQALRARSECTGKAASLGYCMGGRLSYHMAAETDVDAAVCYYGGGIHTALGEASKIRSPILFHFAGSDGFIPPEAITSVRDTFAARPDAVVEVYDGVDHGFNCWDRAAYNQGAAALARGRTLQFLSMMISA